MTRQGGDAGGLGPRLNLTTLACGAGATAGGGPLMKAGVGGGEGEGYER